MSIATLAAKLGRSWPAIAKAEKDALEQMANLQALLRTEKIDSEDISVVVFGSLARLEWTGGSDLDWTILVDGEADHEHANTAHKLADQLDAAKFRSPGSSRTFGTLTFSHNVIHQIGGADDSNRNTTQRLLLLLESVAANRREAYDRVVRGVLRRYLQNDSRDFRLKVPRFLLNDLHRFWRTMCVDYASKYREQDSQKWAIRNVKLRMSRKLIFASGLLICFNCDEDRIRQQNPGLAAEPTAEGFVEHLTKMAHRTPLDILADELGTQGANGAAALVFDSYNAFLGKLDDESTRQHREELPPKAAARDSVFQEMQTFAASFKKGLEMLFFDSDGVRPLTRRYGVF